MRSKISVLVAALLALFFAWEGIAQADFQPYGGYGGTPFTKTCGPNQYVAGFFGHVGEWLDNIGLTCAEAFGTTSFHAPAQTVQFFGGLSGAPSATQCETGTAVSHIHLFIQYDRTHNDVQYVRGISYDCAHADGSFVSNMCFGVCHDGDLSGGLTAEFSNANPQLADNNCAPGLVTGLTGSTSQYVVSLAALCGPRPQAASQVTANNGKPIKITGAGSAAPDQQMICTCGGMTATAVSGTSSSYYVSFVAAAQGANVAQPPPGQCAWSTGPIGSVWNRLGVGTAQPVGQQLLQAARSGGSFVLEARTLGNGIVYVDRIDSVQLASTGGNGSASSAPPAGSGYLLVCQGGNGMRISGGGATLGGPSFFAVSFTAASEAGNAGQLEPGSCAWIDRPLNSAEPLVLDVPNNLLRAGSLKQALANGSFQVHANNTGKALLVNQIDKVRVNSAGNASLGVDINIGGQVTGKGSVDTGSGSGGSVLQPPIAEGDGNGTPATIARAVNVHTTAGGGSVLGSLAAGTSVTDLGCSKGWCHIAFQGGDGFVAQSFLSQ